MTGFNSEHQFCFPKWMKIISVVRDKDGAGPAVAYGVPQITFRQRNRPEDLFGPVLDHLNIENQYLTPRIIVLVSM